MAEYATIRKKYTQKSISERIEALFLDNVGKIVTREQILKVAIDPATGRIPENWHQRLSELRTDKGYTILSRRDRKDLEVSEYLMPSPERNARASSRILIKQEIWAKVLLRAKYSCEWTDGNTKCGLKRAILIQLVEVKFNLHQTIKHLIQFLIKQILTILMNGKPSADAIR